LTLKPIYDKNIFVQLKSPNFPGNFLVLGPPIPIGYLLYVAALRKNKGKI
jgi:hypothetical protein